MKTKGFDGSGGKDSTPRSAKMCTVCKSMHYLEQKPG